MNSWEYRENSSSSLLSKCPTLVMLKKGKNICNYSQAMASSFLSESERNLLCTADLRKTSILISYIGIIFIYIAMVKNKPQHQIKLCP